MLVVEERVDTGYGDVKLCNVLFEGRIGVVSGSDGGRASGYSATEMGAKGGASGVGYVPRRKSKEGDDEVLCIYLGGYEERKRHVDDGAGNNRGGCSIPRDSVFVAVVPVTGAEKKASCERIAVVPLTGVYGAEKMVSSECIGVCDWS
ncbi:hypothetical protein Hamer_G031319 [Homarus americanus]|uniref:Uncharacterized protein n=1 Tax=Homarus americanus TaxID=6706 RepID=A0A8J5NCH9_HOMAM|nr:hypothetical protein Hamer_G031319 [Homarus americanus]